MKSLIDRIRENVDYYEVTHPDLRVTFAMGDTETYRLVSVPRAPPTALEVRLSHPTEFEWIFRLLATVPKDEKDRGMRLLSPPGSYDVSVQKAPTIGNHTIWRDVGTATALEIV